MRKYSKKSALLAATALAVVATAPPAQAFETIEWTWLLDIDTDITQIFTMSADLTPTGIVVIENDQTFTGAASATSTVTAPLNVPPVVVGPSPLTDLAKVESTATAVGNNATIESDLMTDINSNQVVGLQPPLIEGVDPPLLVPTSITAVSSVIGATDVQVASMAQAIANNLSVTMNGATGDDRSLKLNNVQVALGTTATATSSVENPTVTNFEGLGTLADPWISSTATAVGNNLNVTVAAPAP